MAKLRFATSAALSLVLAIPAVAQTASTPAAAPASPAAAPAADPAQRNAITNAALPAAEAAMKAHVMFLASDAMKGRDAGSPEYDIAAQYVASQFYAAGLRPMGDDGSYLQKVPLITVKAKDQGSFAYQPPKGAPVPMAFGKDYVPGTNPSKPVTSVDASLAFVGFGIVEPGSKRDDYAGVDVKGKIVLMFGGAPESLHPELRAHFGSTATKRAIAMAKGAVGVLTIEPTAGMITMAAAGYQRSRVTWEKGGVGFDPAPRAPGLGMISQAFAQTLFAGSRLKWTDVVKGAGSAETRFKATVLPGRIAAAINTEWTPLPSSNVVGLLPGGDPKLKGEYVVLSAHLDHVGVGRAVNGDTIYNGAEDNAVGIASLIEEAKKFKASGTPPKRSILFLAVTAEEKGLVGAEYFANNPTVPKGAMVADVNLDMPIITYKFEDVIAFGADRSTLGPIVRKAAASIGVGFSPDPMPEQGLFTRSDHYRFVQQGIPSVFLWPGQAGPGKAAVDDFFKNHYHKPSDEVWQMPALDWSQGVRFVDVNYAIAREIADGAERPRWNKGDFFGLLYGGFGAK
ncbi:M28 family metallopeptidase [Sphingomonas floccifaciens]|uniref:M28 family metallopeptidase n=1 Tax=Sphingomonas floccifaciens TaxID=1844115 RepID=A0ABW4N831_9SPHN